MTTGRINQITVPTTIGTEDVSAPQAQAIDRRQSVTTYDY